MKTLNFDQNEEIFVNMHNPWSQINNIKHYIDMYNKLDKHIAKRELRVDDLVQILNNTVDRYTPYDISHFMKHYRKMGLGKCYNNINGCIEKTGFTVRCNLEDNDKEFSRHLKKDEWHWNYNGEIQKYRVKPNKFKNYNIRYKDVEGKTSPLYLYDDKGYKNYYYIQIPLFILTKEEYVKTKTPMGREYSEHMPYFILNPDFLTMANWLLVQYDEKKLEQERTKKKINNAAKKFLTILAGDDENVTNSDEFNEIEAMLNNVVELMMKKFS